MWLGHFDFSHNLACVICVSFFGAPALRALRPGVLPEGKPRAGRICTGQGLGGAVEGTSRLGRGEGKETGPAHTL